MYVKLNLPMFTPRKHTEEWTYSCSMLWKWIVSLAHRLLYPQGKPSPAPPSDRYRLNKRLGGYHRRSGRFGEEKDLFMLPGTVPRFLCCWVGDAVVVSSSLGLRTLYGSVACYLSPNPSRALFICIHSNSSERKGSRDSMRRNWIHHSDFPAVRIVEAGASKEFFFSPLISNQSTRYSMSWCAGCLGV